MKSLLVHLFLTYLRLFAKLQLLKIHPKIVGIGGSSGKTSVSALTALILAEKMKTRHTKGLNSETGIPLSILGLDAGNYRLLNWLKVALLAPFKVLLDFEKYDVLIIEMGIDGPKPPKNMAYLLSIIKPHVGVLTNIALEHSVYFEGLVGDEDKSKEILEMIKSDQLLLVNKLGKDDFAVVNTDDPLVSESLKQIQANVITVSSNPKSSFYIKDWKPKINETVFVFNASGKDYEVKIKRPLPYYYGFSILLSLAVCEALGVEIKEAIGILEEKFDLPGGRLSVFEGIKNSVIIDSSYNSSIEALSGILEMAGKISDGRRRVGILGDIREQGKQSEELHKKMAEKITETLDFCILIGPLTSQFVVPILQEKNFQFKSFKTFTDAKNFILENVEDGDLIVVKSSQNTLLLERAVEMLLKNKKDSMKLARRGSFWDSVRTSTP